MANDYNNKIVKNKIARVNSKVITKNGGNNNRSKLEKGKQKDIIKREERSKRERQMNSKKMAVIIIGVS